MLGKFIILASFKGLEQSLSRVEQSSKKNLKQGTESYALVMLTSMIFCISLVIENQLTKNFIFAHASLCHPFFAPIGHCTWTLNRKERETVKSDLRTRCRALEQRMQARVVQQEATDTFLT